MSHKAAFEILTFYSRFDCAEDASKSTKITEYFEQHNKESGSWRAYTALDMLYKAQTFLLWHCTPISDAVVLALERLLERVFAPCDTDIESKAFIKAPP